MSFEGLQSFGIVGLQPAELVAPRVAGLLGHLQFVTDICHVLAFASSWSAWASLLTTCSGGCRFLVAMVLSSPSCPQRDARLSLNPD
jgi:hypothetical protein